MQWTETITIETPRDSVYQAVRDQHTLMQWSAWPEATGFTCRVDGDGMNLPYPSSSNPWRTDCCGARSSRCT